ncbi:alpha/beta hydrolase [Pseudomonas syringae pv. aptata]|uniref:alpha/beta hydrolase n=1 Tax=Pseudomonas syringae TaxID=317 RepID=UPI00203E8409|nr:alpha/beta hydrolase [Pseudomonas syringae]MCK0545923.1 alpha/beta hydrolase [Pseudomonas syringae pv. aptata]
MEQPKRTLHELKIALAILRMNAIAGSSRYRVISSSALFFCWRKSPPDTLIEVLRARITGRYAQDTFEVLLKRVEDIILQRRAIDVEAFLSARVPSGANISSAIRNTDYKKALGDAVDIPKELHPPLEGEMPSSGSPDGESFDYSSGISYNRAPVEQIYTTYPIFYGTDRLQEPGRTLKFGGFRSEDTIAYGVAEVSIPHIHREGKLERPWLRPTQKKGNPNKHIVVHSNELMALDAWFTRARDYLSHQGIGQDPSKKEGLLFIHGYNVGFNAALWRAAQLCHDLKFPGLMLCFSWASLGTPGGYPADEATVDWSAGNLRQYLTHVTEQLGLSALHIVAHSMGNRALLSVLENWKHKHGSTPIHQIILAAPDVDTSRFKQFGQVFNTFEQVTLYASRNDRAIAASRFVHSYPRAGDANPPLVMSCLATVDVSAAGKDMFGLGHSYITNVSKVFRDLFYVVRHRHKPDQRAGINKRDEGYWELT